MKFIAALVLLSLGTLAIVIPNSLQFATMMALSAASMLGLLIVRVDRFSRPYALMIIASVFITLLYLIVGQYGGAPWASVWQVVVIYILAPVMWVIAALLAFHYFGGEVVARSISLLAVPTVLLVVVYFLLFLSFGPAAVSFFIDEGNVDFGETSIAGRLHAYGSLIFIAGGIFSAPEIIRNPVVRVLIPMLILGAMVTSGRSALILALPIGLFVFFLANLSTRIRKSQVVSVFCVLVAIAGVGYWLLQSFDLSILGPIVELLTKIAEGGGSARQEQALALWNSFSERYMLGAGHGVGTDVIRSVDYPWRYELIWLATLHRVGLIGSIVYVLPFLIYMIEASVALLRKRLPIYQRFFLGGFVAAFIAGGTNPYIESFAFQWMFVLPVLDWFLTRRVNRKPRRMQALHLPVNADGSPLGRELVS